ncbi:hypothetical protein EXIGLDRAFT_769772 [Exidia glandulosa HHB12029]|uniref:Hydrophobin n=1 Tax=Exidia glandulosa HHB12029 TaxID=1314781 RepID=A0A165ZA09_EXIGL|nr:hypothetical protein EXIGLDRAFT_780637 [Exidia glandulosa HHB12029]KZV91626.1 hypothetical protein EXIGLDRAFT_769772 [Exidia glandulosa HHB12029]
MFQLAAVLSFTTLVLSVFAVPSIIRRDSVVQCSFGSAMCCNSVQQYNASTVSNIMDSATFALQNPTGQIGIQCVAVSVMGAAGGSSCKNTQACCGDAVQNGLININCSPLAVA